MNRMTWIAAGLFAILAVLFAAGWFSKDSTNTPARSAGGGPVKFNQALAGQGEQVFTAQGCSACHTTDGSTGAGPTLAGSWGTEVELDGGATAKFNEPYLKEALLNPSAQVVSGFSPSMPSFEGKLSEQDIAALAEYIKSLNGQ